MRMRLDFIALLMLAAACGGSAASSETTPDQLKGAPPPVLPLPADPWAIAPHGDALIYVDAIAVRSSPHTTFLRDLARQHCLKPEHEALLFEKTDSVLLTGLGDGPKAGEGIMILRGRFAESDAQLVMDMARTRTEEPITERMHKRVRILTRSTWSAARIGDSLLVVGDNELVQQAAALAEGEKLARIADSPLLASTGAREELPSNTLVLVLPASDRLQRETGRSLGAVGLPRDLLHGVALGLLKLNDAGAQAELRIRKDSAQIAGDAASTIQRKLGQLSLLARLAGLPPVLDKTEARANDAELRITLSASQSDLEALRARLADLIDQPPASCTP